MTTVKLLGLAGVLAAIAAPSAAQRPPLRAVPELTLRGAELDFVSIASLVVGPRGRIYVWQDADGRIRRFESDGLELEPVARSGEGPGEFRMRSIGGTVGDTFWVSDPILRRTTFILPDGSLLRTTKWPPGIVKGDEYFAAGLGVQPLLVEASGTVVTRASRGSRTEVPAWWPDSAAEVYVRVGRDGALQEVVAGLPALPRPCVVEVHSAGMTPGTIRIPFCQGVLRDASLQGNRIATIWPVAGDDAGDVLLVATTISGRHLFERRISEPRIRVPRAVADSVRRERTRPQPIQPARMQAIIKLYREMRFPEYYPTVSDIFVGSDGTTWLMLRPGGAQRHWRVISPRGDDLGTVALPASFRMHHADGERIWGTVLDDDDLPSVVRYRVQ